MFRKPTRHLVFAVVIASAAAVAGCTGSSFDKSFSAAKVHLDKGELPAAIIELKNALNSKPDSAEARFLLGSALLEREEPTGAVVELRKASELGYPADQVVPVLAKAYVETGEARKAVELRSEARLTAPAAVAGLAVQTARAHAALNNPQAAEAALNDALKVSPDFAPALQLRARSLLAKQGISEASKIADALLARMPGNPDALTLKGDVLLYSKDVEGADRLYSEALTKKSDYLPAHIGRLALSLSNNNLDAARAQLGELRKVRPNHPQTLFFEARLASQSGDLKTANELVQQLLKGAAEDPQVLQLAGIVAMQRNEWGLAANHLGKLLQKAPEHSRGRQLLADVYLRLGEPTKTLEVLRPVLDGPRPDSDSLSLAGQAYLQSGDPRRAEEAIKRALGEKPNDVRSRAAMALARIAQGDETAGLRELEAAASADPGTDVDLMLIAAQSQRRNHEATLKAIERLAVKQPGKALPVFLRGQALTRRGDLTAARKNYEQALALEPGFFPAVDGLALLDLREKNFERARSRFEAALKANPAQARALLGMAIVDEMAGKPKQEVVAQLEKAVALNRSDPTLRRRLIEYHLRKQDFKLALAAAQDAAGALPNDAGMLALLAQAELASGNANQAISAFNKWVAAQPKSVDPLLGLTHAHLAAKSYGDAADTVKKALVLAPDSFAVMQVAVKVDVLAGKYDQALARARTLQTKSPKSAQGWILEGDIELSRRNWSAAAVAFRGALQKEESGLIAERLHRALRNTGDKEKSDAFAVDWLKKHPKDASFLFYLSGLALEDKNLDAASTQLEEVLRASPDNPLALNNMAWVQATLKKPGAVALAERVNRLSPNQPVFMDTLAYALASEGKIAPAIEVQKKALELAPSAHGLRLNMARLYLQAGDKAAARSELDALAKLGDTFPQQSEVRELQAKL